MAAAGSSIFKTKESSLVRIAVVHNEYGRISGEEVVVQNLASLLDAHGHQVSRFRRSSAEIPSLTLGSVRAFGSGIYNPFSRRAFARFLSDHRPDVVHVHNVFPLISPSILPECRQRGIPVVMTLHNYRLVCPNGLLLRKGRPCHDCLGGREYRCVRHNCEGSIPRSLGYALRTAFARQFRLFVDNVDRFLCLTGFQRDVHVGEGFPATRCRVVPNPAPREFFDSPPANGTGSGSYVAYVGRISPEKDLDTLLEAARRLPDMPFKVAGTLARMPHVAEQAPPNVEFVGQLGGEQLRRFYAESRLLAFTTRYYEGFPMVLVEAMALGLPIVCTRTGGLPEIVENDRTGLLYNAGDPVDLASKIRRLWCDSDLRGCFGRAGRAKAVREYHPDVVYAGTAEVYAEVMGRPARASSSEAPKPDTCVTCAP